MPVKKEGVRKPRAAAPAAGAEEACINLCTSDEEDSPPPAVSKTRLPEVTTVKGKAKKSGKLPAAAPSSIMPPLQGEASTRKAANDDDDDELMLVGEKSGDLEVSAPGLLPNRVSASSWHALRCVPLLPFP